MIGLRIFAYSVMKLVSTASENDEPEWYYVLGVKKFLEQLNNPAINKID